MNYILHIIKSILNNAEFEERVEADDRSIYQFTKAHHIAGLIAFCQQAMEGFPEDIKKLFTYEKNRSIAREATQQIVITALLDKMEEKRLFCMPLKGYQTKNMYPHPAMRYMTDTDILIDSENIEKITEIMTELGFAYDHDTLHEVIFSNNQMVIEFHKTLVPSKLGKSYEYYKDYSKFVRNIEGKQFVKEMSTEDIYIYSVDHIARHYIEGGIGIKHIVDIYVLLKQTLNIAYIEEELSKLELNEFEKNLKTLAYMWFSDKKIDVSVSVLEMADFVLKSGAYGNDTNRTVAGAFLQDERLGKKQSNLVRIIKRTFVSPTHIKMLYPVVKKHRYLYPVFILVRIWDVLFRRKDTKQKLINMAKISDFEKEVLKKHFEKIGLPKEL